MGPCGVYEKVEGRTKSQSREVAMQELIRILMESPLYWTMSVAERLDLLRFLMGVWLVK
jgi:hypothetical protein